VLLPEWLNAFWSGNFTLCGLVESHSLVALLWVLCAAGSCALLVVCVAEPQLMSHAHCGWCVWLSLSS
jgi:hypothetical protein